MIRDLLLYVGLPFGGLAAVAAAFIFLTPWGPAALTLFANSRLARIAAGVGAAALAVGLACLRAFRAGKATGLAGVEDANRRAVLDRRAEDAKAAVEPDDQLRRTLNEWGPR